MSNCESSSTKRAPRMARWTMSCGSTRCDQQRCKDTSRCTARLCTTAPIRCPPWLQETLSSYVSILNECAYSLANHWANARHLIGDDQRADAIEDALHSGVLTPVFSGRDLALLNYARKLTQTPNDMIQADVQALRLAGLDDGEILEANQVIAYFNYANRLVNGLGVTTDGDVVGYYPTT